MKIKDDPLIWDDLGMFGECYPKFGMAIYVSIHIPIFSMFGDYLEWLF